MAAKQPRRGAMRGGGGPQTRGEEMEAMIDAWHRLGTLTELQGDSGGRQQRGRSRTRWPRWGPDGTQAQFGASGPPLGTGAAPEEGSSQEEGACGPARAVGDAEAAASSRPCPDVSGSQQPREHEESEGSQRRRERQAVAAAALPQPLFSAPARAMSGNPNLALGARPRQPMGGRGRGRPRGRGQSRGELREAGDEAGARAGAGGGGRGRAASPSPPPPTGPLRYSLRSRARAALAALAASPEEGLGFSRFAPPGAGDGVGAGVGVGIGAGPGAGPGVGPGASGAFQDLDAAVEQTSPRKKRGPRGKTVQVPPEIEKSNSDEETDDGSRSTCPEDDEDEEEEEEEEEEVPRPSLGSLQQRPQSRLEKKVCEVVQYLLVKDQTKVPIQRTDIVNTIIKEYKDMTTEILNRAGQMLEQVFGIELKEIDDKAPAYVLINKLEPLEDDCMRPKHETAKMGLLMVILSLIFMKGNCAKESMVWDMLRKMRLNPDKKHPLFGDVKMLITDEFVRQRYLEYNRIPYTDPEEYEFLWGPRAFLETSKMQVLRFVAKIQKRDPRSWTIQYNEALRDEAVAAAASASTASTSTAAASASASALAEAEEEAEEETEAEACASASASASFLE